VPAAVSFYMDAGAGDSSAVPCSRPHPRCYIAAAKRLDIPRNMYLDDDGNCYAAGKPGCYLPADFEQELSKLEELLKGLGATLETSYDESFIIQKRDVLHQHGVSLVTIQVEPDEVTIH
jgi:hypothetical protein